MVDSIKKRYGYKLLTNGLGLCFTIITQMFVTRGLGPTGYGDFSYLMNFFTQLIAFFEMGTSTCFYTKLSQRHDDTGLIKFFFYFALLVAAALIVFTAVALFLPACQIFWPGQMRTNIILAGGLCFLLWAVQMLNSMLDALGITVPAEKVKILQRGMIVLVVGAFFMAHQLFVQNFFYIQYAAAFFLVICFISLLKRSGFMPVELHSLSFTQAREYAQEFYHYTHPLFVYSLIGMVLNILDRWLLQIFSGSVEQGFFGLSFQVGTICILFTSALTPLLTREFSIAYARKDMAFMQQFLQRYFPLLFIMAAFLSCFIAVQSKVIIFLVGGTKFEYAFWPMVIMAFYPVYQTYGQLTGSVFFATGETGLYRNLGVAFFLLGLPMSYLLLGPKDHFGLSAGAAGLAVKMVLIQVVGVNVSLYYICRILKIRFLPLVTQQAKILATFAFLSYLAMQVANSIGFVKGSALFGFGVSGIVYGVMVIAALYYFPAVGGMSRSDITLILEKIPWDTFKLRSRRGA